MQQCVFDRERWQGEPQCPVGWNQVTGFDSWNLSPEGISGAEHPDMVCRLLKVPEVAAMLGLGLTKTWELVESGVIPSLKLGRARRVRLRELLAWLDEQSEQR